MLTLNTTEAGGPTSATTTSQVAPWISVGTDLVLVADVRDSIDMFGDRYLRRVYTPSEIDTCRQQDGQMSPSRLAARFAAKEAAVKALRTNEGVSYLDIEVINDPTGAPTLSLTGSLKRRADESGVVPASLSLAHHGEYAMAVCLFIRSAAINSTETTGPTR